MPVVPAMIASGSVVLVVVVAGMLDSFLQREPDETDAIGRDHGVGRIIDRVAIVADGIKERPFCLALHGRNPQWNRRIARGWIHSRRARVDLRLDESAISFGSDLGDHG